MTELETFVKETLVGIVRAVKAAQDETLETGARINPNNVNPQGRAQTRDGKGVEDVRFEVALVASKERKAGGALKIQIASAGKDHKDSNASVSRVLFSVPVCWPQSKD